MKAPGKIRVLLAEDHRTVREGVKFILASQPDIECVGEAGDGRAAVQLARELRPDVVLMDVSMPEMNGLKATERLADICPDVRVLALTRHTDRAYLQQLLQAGAAGYVLKQSDPSVLLQGVRSVAAGGSYLDPAITGKALEGYFGRKTSGLAAAAPGISDRESEVLRHIALGYSNKEIAARMDISVKTVEAHKANAMRKLDMTSRIDIVRYAILQGWLHAED
ncbi:MAG TPA: response regulator transcription factor [Pyrinomonadaceae bacterium]|nr:response regulator transcription factor [Pyrinomonadaceae bacterium]